MREEHVEQVLGVLRGLYKQLPNEDQLREKLQGLRLKTGPASTLGKRRDPRSRWIEKARAYAREYIGVHGQVTIHIIIEQLPLPDGVDVRATGGVLKHPDFTKIGHETKRMPNGRLKTVGVFGLSRQTTDENEYPRF